jgi:hypothetical protein
MAEISGLVLLPAGMSPSQVARDSLDILSRDGWCKWTTTKWTTAMSPGAIIAMTHDRKASFLSFPEGSHCLGGAWNVAHHGDPWWVNNVNDLYEPVADVIKAQYPEAAGLQLSAVVLEAPSLIMWLNDAPVITEADVRAILEKLAAG